MCVTISLFFLFADFFFSQITSFCDFAIYCSPFTCKLFLFHVNSKITSYVEHKNLLRSAFGGFLGENAVEESYGEFKVPKCTIFVDKTLSITP